MGATAVKRPTMTVVQHRVHGPNGRGAVGGFRRGDEGREPLSANRWPEGQRRLPCLRCTRPFTTRSKANRICRKCRVQTPDILAGGLPEAELKLWEGRGSLD